MNGKRVIDNLIDFFQKDVNKNGFSKNLFTVHPLTSEWCLKTYKFYLHSFRYLYTGVMPMPANKPGVFPIFYFLMASHDEISFKTCLFKFFEDAKELQKKDVYRLFSPVPYMCVTDMSLVIFRPCLGNY